MVNGTAAQRAMAGRNFTDACGAERPPDPAQPGSIPALLMAAAASGPVRNFTSALAASGTIAVLCRAADRTGG
jgi:hypothetical protein